jgi:photosynthetic reaction center cytochrome c subunit
MYRRPAIFADFTGFEMPLLTPIIGRMKKPPSSLLCFLYLFWAHSAAFAQKPQLAEDVFKNVQVLKGLPADEFMSTMGIFSAALGMSCEDCHASNDAKWENYALDTSPRKVTARKMVQMVAALNKNNFAGVQMITCWTCHRGTTPPKITPNLNTLYNLPDEPDDLITQAPNAPPVDKILDRYIQAVGGAERLSRLTSFVAKGTSAGYGPESTERPVDIYAKAPGQRTTIIHTQNGDNITVIDGTNGWSAIPLKPVPVMQLTGGALEGAKFEAALSFPLHVNDLLSKWRVGFPSTIDDRDVEVIQGSGPGGLLVTMYFDSQSGLLVRLLRYAQSPVGRTPTQIDYSDYRDVAGVKMPFRWKVAWLDGKENFEIKDVQTNVSIDPARFGKP